MTWRGNIRRWGTGCIVTSAALVLLGGCKKPTGQGGATGAASAEDVAAGKAIFDKQCVACHTVGEGARIGPDLKDVQKRREADWLVKWIKDPVGMGQNDPIGKKLMAEFKNVPMPAPNLNDQQIGQVLAFVKDQGGKATGKVADTPAKLDEKVFAETKQVYFDRCAGCHGTLRVGATGPNIEPKRSLELGRKAIAAILTNGTPRGMPAWGREKLLSDQQIDAMSHFLQLAPPDPPQLPLEKVKASWKMTIAPKDRPKKPMTKRNWQNYFGVVLRDAGKVAILDGDTKELVEVLATGYAVHILRASASGRYFYAVGRDGRVTMIDLWTEKPTMVAQVQGCYDARSVDGSKFKGYVDKLVIQGCYWPPQYVVYDGQTLEPKKVVDVLMPTYDTKEPLKEVRVAAIVASHYAPVWVANLKEAGFVAIIDYSKPDFPMTAKIPAERFLHDGGWDRTGRYYMVAANMRNTMVIIDVKEQKAVAKFKVGDKPHPGRGANWEDPEFGWVNATSHIGEGKLVVYGADPKGKPQHAWKVVRDVKLPAAGGLFVKTHPKSPWVWADATLSNEASGARQICVYSKKEAKIHKCWEVSKQGRAVHFEYNKDGTEVWVSAWDKEGELAIYNDKTLEEVKRIKADWLVTPTGKFNVWNTAHDVY